MSRTRKIIYGSLIALCAVLLVLGAFFDKNIAEKMYQPDNVIAKVMQSVGIFPPFIFIAGMFAVLFYLVKGEQKNALLKKCLTASGVALSYAIFGFMATEHLLESVLSRMLIAIGSAVMLSPLTFLLFRTKSREQLKRLSIFLIFASMVSLISSLISINALKYLWGRVRYREMIATEDYLLESFTPWYQINGFSLHGHHSFPSGHTSAAANLLVFCALPEVFPEAEGKQKVTIFLCAAYIVSMAYSRMVLGAHFLSDVTVGFLIGFLTYAIARYLYFDKSRIVVDAILDVNRMSQQEHDAESVTDEPLPLIEDVEGEGSALIEIPDEIEQSELSDEEGGER